MSNFQDFLREKQAAERRKKENIRKAMIRLKAAAYRPNRLISTEYEVRELQLAARNLIRLLENY